MHRPGSDSQSPPPRAGEVAPASMPFQVLLTSLRGQRRERETQQLRSLPHSNIRRAQRPILQLIATGQVESVQRTQSNLWMAVVENAVGPFEGGFIQRR